MDRQNLPTTQPPATRRRKGAPERFRVWLELPAVERFELELAQRLTGMSAAGLAREALEPILAGARRSAERQLGAERVEKEFTRWLAKQSSK